MGRPSRLGGLASCFQRAAVKRRSIVYRPGNRSAQAQTGNTSELRAQYLRSLTLQPEAIDWTCSSTDLTPVQPARACISQSALAASVQECSVRRSQPRSPSRHVFPQCVSPYGHPLIWLGYPQERPVRGEAIAQQPVGEPMESVDTPKTESSRRGPAAKPTVPASQVATPGQTTQCGSAAGNTNLRGVFGTALPGTRAARALNPQALLRDDG